MNDSPAMLANLLELEIKEEIESDDDEMAPFTVKNEYHGFGLESEVEAECNDYMEEKFKLEIKEEMENDEEDEEDDD